MPNNCLVGYIPFLQTLSGRYSMNPDDQQDLVQNVLLRILQGSKDFDEIKLHERKQWLATVMHHANVDRVRKLSLSAPFVTGEAKLVDADKVALRERTASFVALGPEFILATLNAAIVSFPENHQKVIKDVCLHGKEADEVATENNCHVSAVYRILRRARQAVITQYREVSMFEKEKHL